MYVATAEYRKAIDDAWAARSRAAAAAAPRGGAMPLAILDAHARESRGTRDEVDARALGKMALRSVFARAQVRRRHRREDRVGSWGRRVVRRVVVHRCSTSVCP